LVVGEHINLFEIDVKGGELHRGGVVFKGGEVREVHFSLMIVSLVFPSMPTRDNVRHNFSLMEKGQVVAKRLFKRIL